MSNHGAGCCSVIQEEYVSVICEVLGCDKKDIVDVEISKSGMTNCSYTFSVNGKKYIMRIPGEGTDLLINRKEEAEVYAIIKHKNICEDLCYINAENGLKISAFVEDSRCCNPYDAADLIKCMRRLRDFHNMKLEVGHTFNIYEKIDFYESLRSKKSVFDDYEQTKRDVLSLKKYIDVCNPQFSLTHIDAVPDNFLFSRTADGKEDIRLIDWEYAGMQDPHVDIAMFCVYSLYKERKHIDRLIDIYFENTCTTQNRIKIYCYVALCGLLWSNWCEYKRSLGVEFGEYALLQYEFAREYYALAVSEMREIGVSL